MVVPTIVALDDEAPVLSAINRDLRRHYGGKYRILRSSSGHEALESVREIRLRNEPIALFLVDQRMPEMTGVEFLQEAMKLFPDAKRVLLTAYADTEVAIKAINEVNLDYYLLKPWDPPEERLYPILDDVLSDWQAIYEAPFSGIRIVGHRWSPHTYRIKDFLARNQIPYQWLDILTDETQQLVEQLGIDTQNLPAILFPDGSQLVQPSNIELSQKIGLQTQAKRPFYDLAIVGGGPAGLAAAVYGGSEGLETVLIERDAPGGQAGQSSRIENYLGFPSGLSGADLARRAVTQARRFGTEIILSEVCRVNVDGPYKIIQLGDGSEISCHALIIATGVDYRRLDVPGAERLAGSGVYYGGAIAEAIASAGQNVFIIGGANSAGQAAMYFARYATSVTMLVRADSLAKSMSQYLIEQIKSTENIRVWPRTEVVEVFGDERLEEIEIVHKDTDERERLAADGLFIFIGARPHTGWIAETIALDPQGFVLSGQDVIEKAAANRRWPLKRAPLVLETSEPGIFVAGDVRHRSMRRIASATGEGAMAVHFVHQYLSTL
jgi:thioredoxin reductase (NADPH)